MCDPPKRSTEEPASWDIDTLRSALDMIEDDLLHLAVHSSLRIGEAMALSWDDVDFVKKEIHIRKTLQRVSKQALEELPSESLYFTFPPKQLDKKTPRFAVFFYCLKLAKQAKDDLEKHGFHDRILPKKDE